MVSRLSIHKLACDAYAGSELADTAFKAVADAELATYLLPADAPSLESKARVAGYEKDLMKSGEFRDQVVSKSIREILLLRVPTEIREGDDHERMRRYLLGDGRLGQDRSCLSCDIAVIIECPDYAIKTDRFADILERS